MASGDPVVQRSRRRAGAAAAMPRSRTALLLVDVINPLRFEGADALAAPALAAARRTARLKRALGARGVPAIYVNDNFGHWRSDFAQLVEHCLRRRGAAGELARLLAPRRGDFTVLKPRYSAFDSTPLELLLTRMASNELVVTGIATDLCVQFTAADAYVRGYALWVPADCTAAESPARKDEALRWMERALRCHVGAAWG